MKSITINPSATPGYDYSEAVNTLCTNLIFADAHSILFTNCLPDESKSFVAMHVMRTLVGMGHKVVLIDADLRKSVLTTHYGIDMDGSVKGLCHYLEQQCDVGDIVYETDLPGAYMIPAGKAVSNSIQLLGSNRLPDLMAQLRQTYDYILVDTPPISMIVDAAITARACDGAVFVIADGQVRKRDLSEAKRLINKAGCPVLGVAFNKVTFPLGSYRRYYYRHNHVHYGEQSGQNGTHTAGTRES